MSVGLLHVSCQRNIASKLDKNTDTLDITPGRCYYTEMYIRVQLSIPGYNCSYLEEGDVELPIPQQHVLHQDLGWAFLPKNK